ncbi:transglycosylase SLT domain-containing protein [Bacillus pumilus]|nr:MULTISPECIES: transglycosylase SLT domain-containing protein [Bacillus]MBU5259200.1 transglycosylase SLT domain-containing protein [Bacillus pumilus]MCK6163592.1 transglycosylase SLT domain-containing protein [Bacillus pumilus]MCK6184098.1 transglycosylase SLT domain-containing protein [Bacillus pumilus]PRS51197.1 transglycosylase [Bacillus sp. LNXM10]
MRIQKRFQTFEKQLKPFRKPVKINLEIDEKKLRNFSLSLRKISVFSMRLDQGIYRDLKALNNQLNMLPNHLVISIQAKGLDVIKSSINRLKQAGTSPILLTFKLNDQLSGKMSSIKKSIYQLMNRTYYMRLNMVDQATAAIQRIKKTLKSLTMSKHEIRVSVQDNAKSKLKKRDQAESIVKEQNIKKEPEAVSPSVKTDESKQSWLQNLANKGLNEIQKYAGDVADKVKEKLSPRKFWDEKALPWVENKMEDYKQDVIGRIKEKIKFNPEEKLDQLVKTGLDRLFGASDQSSESATPAPTTVPTTAPTSTPTSTPSNPAPKTKPQPRGGKGLFRNSCCPCCARGLSRGGSTKTKNRNGQSPRQSTNPNATTRTEMNRRPPSRLGKLKTNAGKLFGKIPSGLKKGAGIAASVGGLTGLVKGSKGLSGLGNAMKSIGKGSGKLLKKVPILGSVLSATNLIGMNKENAGEKIGTTGGGIAGGMAGAAAGAAIGSVVPGVGTAIGGLVGGIAGSMGGESIGETIGKWFDGGGFEKIGQKAIEIKNQIVEVWSTVAAWFTENVWTPLSNTVVTVASSIWSSLVNAWTWIQETFSAVAGWFIENVWTPLSDTVVTVATTIWTSLVNAWTWIQETFSAVAGWFIENVWTPLSSTVVTVATTIWSSLVNAWTWIQETFSAVAGWFIENVWTPLSSTVVTVATGIWTALSNAWKTIQSIFGAVSSWFMENVWNPLVDTVGTIKDSIGKKFEEAYKVVTDIWDGLSKWFEDNIQKPIVKVAEAISDGFSAAFGWVKKIFDKAGGIVDVVINWIVGKKKPDNNATGGYITQPTLSWVGEAGNEFVIPTQNNRGRGKMLLAQAASHLGMSVMPSGAAGNQVSSSPAPTAVASSSSVGSIDGSVSMTGNIQASSIGEQFNKDFEQGLNQKVITLDQWKQKNIQQPFAQLTSDSGKYGQQTVAAFANGQQVTPTGTDSFLQSRVKAPYQQVMTASPTWGSGTVNGFATGQNATSVGTSQYVDQHIKQPFLQAKQESPGWGSGMMDAFNNGMRSKASEVTQAAKEMAKKVEQAFREELDIHSPSRVMMSLGKFASIGVVKGLDSVDVKKFAENQAGSLIGAFSGMGASGLSVQQWLMAALMATGTSMNWLPGLMTIAQHESNGNPRAINLWDSNAKKGTPSKGLMQTIGPTFNSNKGKGMNDIWNPIHNAVAAINYIKGRYGTVFNTPGLRSMRRGGPYKGYANGGLITQEQVARVGEGNKREWIIPEERGIRGRYLLTQAAKALGMQVYDPANASAPLPESQMQQVTSAQSSSGTTASGNKQITIQFNGDQHFHNGQDQQSLVEKIRQMLVDELEVELHTGTKGVVIDG